MHALNPTERLTITPKMLANTGELPPEQKNAPPPAHSCPGGALNFNNID